MLLKNYFLYNDHAELELTDGNYLTIYFDESSGTILWRYKVGTLINTAHPGIRFGKDTNGNQYYMHNHYETGKPAIVSESVFAKGQPLYSATGPVVNTRMEIIRKGLDQVMSGEPYSAVNYNCQSFVNRASNNINISETVQKVVGGIALGALVFAGIKILKNTK